MRLVNTLRNIAPGGRISNVLLITPMNWSDGGGGGVGGGSQKEKVPTHQHTVAQVDRTITQVREYNNGKRQAD